MNCLPSEKAVLHGTMLIFDFDGILLNSIRETAVTAYNAVTGDTAVSLAELPGCSAQLFMRNRFHFQPAGDALVLMQWCLDQAGGDAARLLHRKEYVALLEKVEEPLIRRTGRFFGARKHFIENHRQAWLDLNDPYQPLWGELIALGAEKVVILTNKNQDAVLELTHHFGLNVMPENIYSGDNGATKIENLKRLHERFGKQRYSFVDDSVWNLQELNEHFNNEQPWLKLLLGSWGYLGPEDALHAERLGFPLCSQVEIIDVVKKQQ
jgi:FMN phosphatase YigB (HAD superfamily)